MMKVKDGEIMVVVVRWGTRIPVMVMVMWIVMATMMVMMMDRLIIHNNRIWLIATIEPAIVGSGGC
jgi:cytochrome c biogenesis protein ResB